MSIATRTGDNGTTGLMYNRRVPKSDARVDTYGTVDELNAALGLARAHCSDPFVLPILQTIQHQLILLMGELATDPADLERYVKDGYERISETQVAQLDAWVREVESRKITYRGWALPGDSIPGACLDVARTTCRRAERRVAVLTEAGGNSNPHILVYLNRTADLLWLLARWVEMAKPTPTDAPAPTPAA